MAENAELITNWTQKASDYAVDEHALDGGDDHCRGTFLLSASALFNFSFTGYGVQCKCPGEFWGSLSDRSIHICCVEDSSRM
ncbi:hypothetical protein ANCDUO_09748 [Ancylostoma duodenale]|uniref:Uncharacterized protein n=1 Tax=Ancylostoma duodenale TaxID=51022 RepID=A0A0C2CT04_9BILA|nr:hypothetical protein ANCDUO_09748 [Ancylostoma duodenale]